MANTTDNTPRRAYAGRDAALAEGRDPLATVPLPAGDNSVNGDPTPRRAYPGRDAQLAEGGDPLARPRK